MLPGSLRHSLVPRSFLVKTGQVFLYTPSTQWFQKNAIKGTLAHPPNVRGAWGVISGIIKWNYKMSGDDEVIHKVRYPLFCSLSKYFLDCVAPLHFARKDGHVSIMFFHLFLGHKTAFLEDEKMITLSKYFLDHFVIHSYLAHSS